MKLTRLIAAALTAVCIFTLTSCKQEDTQTTANDYPVHVADTVVDLLLSPEAVQKAKEELQQRLKELYGDQVEKYVRS